MVEINSRRIKLISELFGSFKILVDGTLVWFRHLFYASITARFVSLENKNINPSKFEVSCKHSSARGLELFWEALLQICL